MTTPYSAMAAVAAGMSGIDPRSEAEVEKFYDKVFPKYGEDAREMLLDWLASTVDVPSAPEVDALIQALNLRIDREAVRGAAPGRQSLYLRRFGEKAVRTKRVLQGVVVSRERASKMVIVKVERQFIHPSMKKIVRRPKKYHATDETNVARVGHKVMIEQRHPYSKIDAWRLVEDFDAVGEATGTNDQGLARRRRTA